MDIIKQVRQNNSNGQKTITIPMHCDIAVGDYVQVLKVKLPSEEL